MKLIFKGIFKSYDELPKGNLPANAVKFKEIKGFFKLNLAAVMIALPLAYGLLAIVKQRMDITRIFVQCYYWDF